MKFQELPEELWRKILELVPQNDLWRLSRVNRVVLEWFLDAEYREVSLIDYFVTRTVKLARKWILHLLQPHILPRIRSLRIKALAFEQLLLAAVGGRSRLYRVAFLLPSNLGSRFRRHPEPPDIFELCRQLILHLPCATVSLEIWGYGGPTYEYSELTTLACKTLAKQLTSLTIMASWDELTNLFMDTSVTLPRLERLDLTFKVSDTSLSSSNLDRGAEQNCEAFFMLLTPVLRHLSIYAHDASTSSIVLLRFLQCLKSVPVLQKWSIFVQGASIADLGPPVRRLVERTALTLKDLTIVHSFERNLKETLWILLSPDQRHLFTSRIPPAGLFLVPIQPTARFVDVETAPSTLSFAAFSVGIIRNLISVEMTNFPLFFLELVHFLPRPSLHGLRRLKLRVLSFNHQLLQLLAGTLPSLRKHVLLVLVIIPDASQEMTSRIPRYSFEDADHGALNICDTQPEWYPPFRDHDPILWQLKDLRLSWVLEPHPVPSLDNELKTALARMIPSLTYIQNSYGPVSTIWN